MKKLTNFYSYNNFFIILFICIIIWGSLGTKYIPFSELNLLNKDYSSILYDIKIIINNLRYFAPLGLVILLYFLKKKIKYILVFDFITFTIFFTFLVGSYNLYYFNQNLIDLFTSNDLLIITGYTPKFIRDIMMCFYFIFAYLVLRTLDKNELYLFIKISFGFLIFSSLLTLMYAYREYITNLKEYLYFTQFLINGELFGVPSIRSLGLSRNLFIIIIPISLYYFFSKEKKFKILFLLAIIFLSFNIFQLQSRTSLYSYYMYCFIIIAVLFFNKSYKEIVKSLFILILIPQILNITVPITKKYLINNTLEFKFPNSRISTMMPNNPSLSKKIDQMKMDNVDDEKFYDENIDKKINYLVVSEYTSGRVNLWRKTLEIFELKNNHKFDFLGFGPAADRYFLKETVSNSFFYSLISGGILGLVFTVIFHFYVTINLCKFLLQKKKISEDILSYSLIFIIFYILLRGLVESSFVMYGIDNIILFQSIVYLKKFKIT